MNPFPFKFIEKGLFSRARKLPLKHVKRIKQLQSVDQKKLTFGIAILTIRKQQQQQQELKSMRRPSSKSFFILHDLPRFTANRFVLQPIFRLMGSTAIVSIAATYERKWAELIKNSLSTTYARPSRLSIMSQRNYLKDVGFAPSTSFK